MYDYAIQDNLISEEDRGVADIATLRATMGEERVNAIWLEATEGVRKTGRAYGLGSASSAVIGRSRADSQSQASREQPPQQPNFDERVESAVQRRLNTMLNDPSFLDGKYFKEFYFYYLYI